jgi:uncharacterized protein
MIYLYIGIFVLLLATWWLFQSREKEEFEALPIDGRGVYGGFAVEVRKSDIGGRGVFAKRDFKKGEVIEECPLVSDECDRIVNGVMKDYLFKVEGSKCGAAFGYCSMYNHADDCSAEWAPIPEKSTLVITATRDIRAGEEITISYGSGYWSNRSHYQKK